VIVLRRRCGTWQLVAPKGHVMHELGIRCIDKDDAYREAKLWASSWSSAVVKFEDEQDT
jgi:hypothetical protein